MQAWFSRFLTRTAVLAAVACFVSPLSAQPKSGQPSTRPPATKAGAAKPGTTKAAPAAPAKADASKADASKAAPAATEKPVDDKPAAANYAKVFDQWKSLLKDMRKLKSQYTTAPSAEQKPLTEQWTALVNSGNELLPKLTTAARDAYAESPNTDLELARFLTKMANDAVERDDYPMAAELSQVLIENEADDKSVYNAAAIAAYVLNDYDKAQEYFAKAQEAGVLSQYGMQLGSSVAEQKDLWAKEQELRKAESEADDLPRVKLSTSKGDIVIELFENEAPDTVGNFVSLVDTKFYDGLSFHRVLKNFMAQGGDPKGDGTGGPGYQIFCECYKPEYRRHFQGTLSMAHAGKDTGGSQFFITFRQTPELNGKHTAFGRVIEGMDVLAKIQRRDPQGTPPLPEADRILSAEVLRKRDHSYEPRKVE
jgi:cyclophilin family peptidyl-prolyl cis-trans isomerase